jgi:hypothetical protein
MEKLPTPVNGWMEEVPTLIETFFFRKAPVKYRQAPVKYRMECTVAWYNAARASSAQDSLWTAVKQKKIRGRDAVILIRALCLLTTDFAGKRGRERKQE